MKISPNGRLAGKVALVTGGSSGIGRAIAIAYATEGASVATLSRRNEPHEGGRPTEVLISEAGGTAKFFSTDVSDTKAVERSVQAVVDSFDGLDIVTCSAGISGPFGDSRDIDVESFEATQAVNVRGFFVCARAGLRHLVPKGSGRIIAVSSNFANVGVAGMASYCASKGAINSLVRALAVEYGPSGVTVNALCPGSTKTSMSAPFHAQKPVEAAFRAMTPLRLTGDAYQAEAEDIAHAAVYLASDESRFMTGSELTIDGGWSAW